MTTREGLALAAELFGDGMVSSFERLEAARRNLPHPRASQSLVEEVAVLGVGPGDLVADVGAWGGLWSERLAAKYGCRCIALDLSRKGLSESVARGVPAVVADAETLPLPAGSVDLVWCRDTMSTLESPQAVLTEFVRILRPGGGVMLYTAVTTPGLEPSERAWFLKALEAPPWWNLGRSPIDDAIKETGLEVVAFETRSPEYSEALMAVDPSEITDQLCRVAQMRRARSELEQALGASWYQRWLAWSHWQLYLILGKIDTAVWMLRKPPAAPERGAPGRRTSESP